MKNYYIELFTPSFSYILNEKSYQGFFAGFEDFTHIIVKNIEQAKMMTHKEAMTNSNKLDKWNSPISFEIKKMQEELLFPSDNDLIVREII